MPLINVVVILVVVGFMLWAMDRFIPMNATVKTIINAVVIIVLIVYLLRAFGVLGSLSSIRL